VPQNSNPFLDNLARLVTDAAGVATSARREVDGLVKAQIERLLRDVDIVSRDEFEAIREMAILAREENEKLSTRILALEASLGKAGSDEAKPEKAPRSKAPKS
jgi:BMFP domain-containing protein YqiC